MTAKEIGRWGSEGQEGRKRTTWKNTLKVYFKLPLTLYPFFAIYSFMLSGISLMEDRNKLILHKLQPRPKANFVLLRPAQLTLRGRRWGTGLPLGLLFTAVSPCEFWGSDGRNSTTKHFDYHIQKLKHGQGLDTSILEKRLGITYLCKSHCHKQDIKGMNVGRTCYGTDLAFPPCSNWYRATPCPLESAFV